MKLALQLITFLLSFSMTVTAQSSSGTPFFDKQGHRGCRGLLPENTIPGFLKAIDLGVTTLEMDAVITKDNQVILSHEPFMNHEITTLEDGRFVTEANEKEFNIYQMTHLELAKYDVGRKSHPRFPQQQKIKAVKPLLSEVIDAVESYSKSHQKPPLYYNIETKTQTETDGIFHPEPTIFVDLLMAVVVHKKIEDRVIIQSFDKRTLQYLHQKYPTIATALLVEETDKNGFENQIAQLGFLPTIYSPAHELVDLQLLQECHRFRVKLIPWTVNESARIRELRDLGVDGIITDFPNLFN